MGTRRFVRLDHRAATTVLVDVTPAEAAGHRRVRTQMRAVAGRAKRRAAHWARRHPKAHRSGLLPDLADIPLDALMAVDSPALRAAVRRVMGAAEAGPEAAAGFNSAL